ncbi:hypothetical protein crov360 [Cafeteria roenbergensis virus]|uniref:Uncharacterized protein n=1 Tax=Cafeteria roenbergensis virus (strain BV-PW1) TaxID=693272 RepID=E3T5D1_CROVB|nr:hypothetical protein crov360 [Cafeteria roenbergensis virus BV-PW1]ADO67394.1 hypothetical protein crov360 [Cafeteria roenbergensis virus BV-PW1]
MSDNNLPTEIYLPSQKEFKFLLIKPADISNIRYDDPEYKHFICNLNIYEEITTTSSDFLDNMGKALKVHEMKLRNKPFSLHTQYLGTTCAYLYELIHFDLMPDDLPVEIYNGVGNLLKNDYQHLFGNAIMIKTSVPIEEDDVELIDCTRTDLYNLLENRVKHIGVKIDDDNEIGEFDFYNEGPSKFIEEFMINDHKFIEKGFLLHNLQIYYTPGKKMDLIKLIGEGYDQLLIMTKLTDHFYGNFMMTEFNDIKNLLGTECPLECPEEWKTPSAQVETKLKENNRRFIFNKYRALWKAKQIYLN